MNETTTAANSSLAQPEFPKAGRKEWIGLAVIALPCLLYSMDLTVLNLAVPQLSATLKPTGTQLLWIIDIYGFLVAGFLITMGTLGDRIGRRRLLMFGAAFFALASVVAAFAHTAGMLIAARALLGIAGATVAPSTLSLIRNMFHDPRQRTTAISVWMASYSAGGAIGPFVGGALLEYFWWGSVFLVAVPVMVAVLILAPLLLPEYRDPNAGKPDLPSALLSLTAVLSVIFGLKHLAENGLSTLSILAVLAGIFLCMIFIRRQKRLADPLIDLKLFRSRSFSAPLVIYTLTCFVMFGCFVFSFQYLQLVLEYSPIQAGLLALPSFFSFLAGTILIPAVTHRFPKHMVMAAGLILAALGFVLLSRISSTGGLGYLIAANVIFSLGLAPVFTLTTDLIIGAAPPERTGAASAISETGAEFGGALGIALMGSIGTAIYQALMLSGMPAGIPVAAAAAARETLGGAVAEATLLPADTGSALLLVARSAFVEGFRYTALTGTVVVAALAVLAAVALKHLARIPAPSSPSSDTPAPPAGTRQ